MFAAAMENIEEEQTCIESIRSMLDGLLEQMDAEDAMESEKTQMLVVTNRQKCHGASVILQPGVQNSLRKKMRGDYYLLPSSVHGLIAVPKKGMEVGKLREMVREVIEIRRIIESVLIESIRRGMIEFCYPEKKVDAYLDVNDIQIMKAKPSTPMVRLEEYIKNEFEPVLKQGDDPAEVFRVRSNCGDRKFGNSPWYRSVPDYTADGLGLTEEERKVWNEEFWREGGSTVIIGVREDFDSHRGADI